MNIRLRKIAWHCPVRTTINITGHAKNIKGHAAVMADRAGIYVVDGMDGWESGWLDRRIKVKGDLEEGVIKSPVILLM